MRLLDHTHGVVHFDCYHPDCVAACARYQKRWKYERAHGLLRLTSAEGVRLHIATLRGNGWSLRSIAGASGLSPTTMSSIASAGQGKVARPTAAAIMAIDPTSLPQEPSSQTTEPFVPRVGTVRRLQALMAIGYSHTDLAAAGIDSRNLLNQQGRWVTRTTHDNVAEKYRELSRRPGPTPRSARTAAKLGYHGPAAWDDIDRDPEPEVTTDSTDADTVDEAVVFRILDIGLHGNTVRACVDQFITTGRINLGPFTLTSTGGDAA